MAKHFRVAHCIGIVLFAVAVATAAGHAIATDGEARAAPDPEIAAMIGEVRTATITGYADQLSGVTPAIVDGAPYSFETRKTTSGIPIQKATQFAHEFLQRQGLPAQYDDWRACGLTNRNVIGELPGQTRPQEIVLVSAHIDSISETGSTAPGADDDASGATGVMAAAEILAAHTFERTVRFVFFTGEEQGLCGSEAYANAAAARSDNIVAVVNMDMIAYDSEGEPTIRLHTRSPGDRDSKDDIAIADAFAAVIRDYGLDLVPLITKDGEDASDHSSFWSHQYPAILAIEDDYDDFNPYYHTGVDQTRRYNEVYFTAFVKAVVGVAAVLAVPAQPVNEHLYLPIMVRK